MPTTPLGDYLRARRALVRPESAGIPAGGARRVPGLRREEVAMLAEMSVDYYTRLEQGRERGPSAQVLDALSRVLRLDEDARLHLYRVAGLTPGRRRSGSAERVDPQLRSLLEMWPATPAIVLGRAYDVLAVNPLADALFDGFRQGPNLMLKVFLDPDAHRLYPDWESVAVNAVAGFRMLHGDDPHDPRLHEVLRTLTERSPEFVRLWKRHDARRKRLRSKRFHHPDVGELTLRVQVFDVRSAPGQELVVHHAEAGSPSAEALALLGTLAATRARENRAG
ncbi:helix-turn-helix domain-containing protein [Streptomyces phaeoluteigriseus]|uniref:helix-turn-helix domain-containing protein n=1 Tax=Streptomyces phaeoluteigriseus TaxID=114686 RepID=UPI0036AC62A6